MMAVSPATASAQAPATATAPVRNEANEDSKVDIAYAEAVVKLAQIDLQQAVDFNKRLSGAISNAEVDRLRGNVDSAVQYLDMLKKADGNPADKLVMTAEWSLKSAEANYQRALEVNAQAAGAIDKNQIEKLKIIVDLKRASLAKAKAVAASGSAMAVLQAQLDQLQFDTMQLRNRIESIISRR
jgi:hypothetical protein